MAIKKIGLLGGSFDPVHLAHIALAQAACEVLQLDEVQLIPAANPWQRSALSATGEQRIALLNLAIQGTTCLRVNPIEIARGGKTYTIDTLEQLPQEAAYYWILGADQLVNFCSWHRWEDIASKVFLVVAQRPGSDISIPPALQQLLDGLNRTLIILPFAPMAISASEIRERLADRLSVQGLLDVAVAHYIMQNKLYQTPL